MKRAGQSTRSFVLKVQPAISAFFAAVAVGAVVAVVVDLVYLAA